MTPDTSIKDPRQCTQQSTVPSVRAFHSLAVPPATDAQEYTAEGTAYNSMRFFSRVRPRDPQQAFDALWTEDGAAHFSHIQRYKKYRHDGTKVVCSFKSMGVTVRSTMTVLPSHIFFETTAPFVNAQGTWTLKNNTITLEQTVRCPCFAVPIVRKCVQRTLDNLKWIG